MDYCKYCAKRRPTARGDEGFICCTVCGRVINTDMFSDEVTFQKTAGGQSQMSGRFVRSVENDCSESYYRTLSKGKDEIIYLVDNLGIGGGNSIIEQAAAFYKIAVERNFTRGRRTSLVAAACLYIVCRENKKAYLLIDFSEELRVNVYVVGGVFLQLCKLLRLEEHPIVQKLVDPSLFIHRFTERLLGCKNNEVSTTALRILASMKRDWMQTGRKPSGLCGAALYISAQSYGITCSKSDIVSVVHICEATLTKRLIEFENTESGSLTIEEFITKATEFEELLAAGPKELAIKSSEGMELLCQHKGTDIPHFSHGLCRGCYDVFIEISGGLQGGSDPPAFQRAERERVAKAIAAEKAKEADICEEEMEHFSQPDQDVSAHEKLDPPLSEPIGAFEEGGCGKSNINEDMNNVAGDEAESLSDIDDVEVSAYLHDEDEKRLKTIIWETLNREYLEEEAAKEKAAKEAYEAKYGNCPEEFLAGQDLAAAAAEAVAKSRKERRHKRALEAKNAAPAQNAAQAARQMLTKKKLSSKINYDVLEKLFDDSTAPDDTKKRRLDESEFLDDTNNVGQEDEEYDKTSGGMYGEDLYVGGIEQDEEYDYLEEY
ncbi:hypothetical protein ACHQM5_010138 [Ranunculus cassubicifolius]